MDVPIAHIIGTAALIALVMSVTLAYQIIVGFVETNVLKAQLKQVAEYASMNLVNLITLTEFAYGDISTLTVMTKSLKLPEDLGGNPYRVRLVNEGGNYYVQAELVTRTDLTAKSPLPLNSTKTSVIIVTDEIQLPDSSVTPSNVVYGGNPNIVVWCWKNSSNSMCAGIGVRAGGS